MPDRFETYVGALGMWFAISVYSPQKEYFVAIFDVITERKQAEEALHRLNEELEQRVLERTAAFRAANERLLKEVEERRRAEEALRDSEERLRYLSSQLITAQETERQHIGMELHDDLGQLLLVLKMHLSALYKIMPPEPAEAREELQKGIGFINEIIERVRQLSRNLRPTLLEHMGLPAALNMLFEDVRKYHGLEITADVDDIGELFSWEAQVLIYRIFQESLTNIAKHARATEMEVSIKRQDDRVTFRVQDNGRGFDLQRVFERTAASQGLGLAAMGERVRMLKGSFQMWSRSGQGTKISFVAPASKG